MITQQELKNILRYNKTTGLFYWKKKLGQRCRIGAIAGSSRADGYIAIQLNGKTYKAHRLAWLYVTGVWPQEIDHKDFNTSNNVFKNLRLATRFESVRHRRKHKNNNSGFKGVCWHKRDQHWRASINIHGKVKWLGSFANKRAAYAEYCKAAKAHYGAFAQI